YNLYGLLGFNWADATKTMFLFLPLAFWGTRALVLIVAVSLYLLHRSATKSNFFFVGALINLSTFMFSIKMHERYAFPVLAFLLMAYIYQMDKKLLYLYIGTTAAVFVNCLDVFRATLADSNWNLLSSTSRIFSLLTLAVFVYMVRVAFPVYKDKRKTAAAEENGDGSSEENNSEPSDEAGGNASDEDAGAECPADILSELSAFFRREPQPFQIESTEPVSKMGQKDYIALLLLTAVYAAIAFVNLGNTASPQTLWTAEKNETVVIDLGSRYEIGRMQWLLGPKADAKFSVSVSEDNETFGDPVTVETESVFAWSEQEIGQTGRYVRLSADEGELMLMEAAFRGADGELIPRPTAEEGLSPLFDEQALVPENKTYMNSTYFDEIYHGRTAYELLHQMNIYEWTHPPLGKAIISAGVALFGMTPWGWRFSGTLFGVLMLPLLYIFAKRMFQNTYWAFFTALVFAFDFMHFVQTRIATIDTYITFFVIAMYYFMYRYWKTSFYDTPLKKTLPPLFLSGIAMGLGIACKWPGVYAAVGLATLFFIVIFRRYQEYAVIKKSVADTETTPLRGDILKKFKKNTGLTLLACVVFFVVIPMAIYCLSYLPYFATGRFYPTRETIGFLKDNAFAAALLPDNAFGNGLAAVIQSQFDMFHYHAGLVSEHSFSSPWFSWPVIWRPIYYYAHSYSDTVKGGISAFGNPAVWWTGIAAFCYSVYQAMRTRSKTLLFLIIAFMAQLVFWIPVSRTTYIYHYFPCIPFLVLMITYLFRDIMKKLAVIRIPNPFIYDKKSGGRLLSGLKISPATLYLLVVSLFFIVYYPVLTGTPVYAPLVRAVLRLLPSWVLVS
ncbi:MAG: phospholipid carrier-dependent glycosyltransferase, partial [Clostridiales bacterium]|nr:phospholipid carrier-dependent glycosyltransferase [Clostridiales bacterium]